MREDASLQRQIQQVLTAVPGAEARVEVEAGVVYVEGVIATAAHKQGLEQQLRQLPGVQAVVNCLALEHVARLP